MLTATLVYALAALLFTGVGVWLGQRVPWRWLSWLSTGVAIVIGIAATGVIVWSVARATGDRSALVLDLGEGLTYERIAVDEPHRQVFHVATVDLDNPCIGLITTRPGDGGIVAAETGTAFIRRTGADLSINVAFFYPFVQYPFWAATSSGDEVTAMGTVVIDGEWLGDVGRGGPNGLALTNGRLSASEIPADADFAVRGRVVLVADGKPVAPESEAYPRAVAGVDLDTNRLVLLVSDGKQPGYAEGSTYEQVANFLVALGVDEALEFDGGGSATMAATVDGQVELLSRPSHQLIPGRQRSVASHLGITVDPDCEAP